VRVRVGEAVDLGGGADAQRGALVWVRVRVRLRVRLRVSVRSPQP